MSENKERCPHCKGELSTHVVAKAADRSIVSLSLSPMPGERLDIKTIGSTIKTFGDLLTLCGKEAGVPTAVLLDSISADESGKVTVSVLIARWEEAEAIKQRRAKRRKETDNA